MICYLDFETRSELDLKKVGILRYSLHPSTELICMAYKFTGQANIDLWIPGNPFPQFGTATGFHAHNAQFERLIWNNVLSRYGVMELALTMWHCTAARAAAYGLPRGLDEAAKALGLSQRKDPVGHKMMMKYTKPRSFEPTVWWDDPTELNMIYKYCMQDVEVEVAIAKNIPPLSSKERAIYIMDQQIGNRGIGIDLSLVNKAKAISEIVQQNANTKLAVATDGAVQKATQVQRITKWLRENQGVEAKSLAKADVQDMLATIIPDKARKALDARVEGGKTSMAKLGRFQQWQVGGRLNHMLVYFGAHTGRWSARGAQPHNLPRGNVKNPEQYINWIMSYTAQEAYDLISMIDPPGEVISALLRPMFIPSKNKEFLVGDYSAIEATITSWLAGQDDLTARFASDEDVYAVEGKRVGATRQHGKAIILGCGFGMGWKKFIQAAKEVFGVIITEEESKKFVTHFRNTYSCIPRFWEQVDLACRQATVNPNTGYKVGTDNYKIDISCRVIAGRKVLRITLPSGRRLYYHNPRLQSGSEGYTNLLVDKQNSLTQQWEESKLYGGLITENIVQATARDIMAVGMLRLQGSGYQVVLTVHDEVICEIPAGSVGGFKKGFVSMLSGVPSWAPGLPIKVKSFRSPRYKKD